MPETIPHFEWISHSQMLHVWYIYPHKNVMFGVSMWINMINSLPRRIYELWLRKKEPPSFTSFTMGIQHIQPILLGFTRPGKHSQFATLIMAIELVDLSIQNGDFHSFL